MAKEKSPKKETKKPAKDAKKKDTKTTAPKKSSK
jgi:hypothetical protein